MSLKCIVVDDEKRARDILKTYIRDVSYLELVAEFKNALEALDFFRINNSVDIIFLDINMPKLSGINAAKLFVNTSIVFTTAHREFAVEGFELNATDYLLKPFSFNRFLSAVQKISKKNNISNVTKTAKTYIDIKVGKSISRIDFSDLLYIEGLSNYVKVKTTKESLVSYNKLSTLIEVLPNQFMRVHKSYIINSTKITSYSKEFIQIGKKHISIGGTYKDFVSAILIK